MFKRFMSFALIALALAMGVAVIVLSVLDGINADSAYPMLGIGLTTLALTALQKEQPGSLN